MKFFKIQVLFLFTFLTFITTKKIPHSQVPPWVTIETDLKIKLENCVDIGADTQEFESSFVNLQDSFKQYKQHKVDKNKEAYAPEEEKINLKRYQEDPNSLPLTSIVDQLYVFNAEGETSLKQLYRAYPTLTDEINLAHHNVLEEFFMKDQRKTKVACGIDNVDDAKGFQKTIFGEVDQQQKENKNKMMLTNFFYDITYVLGEVKKQNIQNDVYETMKTMYFITQISKKIFEFVGYISGQKNFCEYIIQKSSTQIEIEQFEDISALEDMFDARLLYYQRKIHQYLEQLKNEKGVFENVNYSGLFVAKKANQRAGGGQDSPLHDDSLEGGNFMLQQVEKLDGNNLGDTFKTFGDMDISGLPTEQISDAVEAIEIIQKDFPRYINQIEKDEIIRRKEQAYLKIIPLLKSIHAYGRILEVENEDNIQTQKLTKGEYRELRQSKQRFLHLMNNIQKRTGKTQQKFLNGLVDDLVHLERITKQRQLLLDRKLNKKPRKLLDTKCDPYFFRMHPLIIKNWTPAMIEIKSEFTSLEKEEQTPDKIYENIQFSPLVFPESLNKVDFKTSFGESQFTKFLEDFTEHYDMNQHKFYFVVKYFHDFLEALIKEYAIEKMDFYSCYQKVRYFSYQGECPLQQVFTQIATEVNFAKLSQLKTGNFLEDGEELYKELEKFIHHLDLQVKVLYEQSKDEKNKVDKEVQPIELTEDIQTEDNLEMQDPLQTTNQDRKLNVQII